MNLQQLKHDLELQQVILYCNPERLGGIDQSIEEHRLLYWVGENTNTKLIKIPSGPIDFHQYQTIFSEAEI